MQITLEYYEIQILGLIDAPGAQWISIAGSYNKRDDPARDDM